MGTNVLEVSIGRDLGALKGLTAFNPGALKPGYPVYLVPDIYIFSEVILH